MGKRTRRRASPAQAWPPPRLTRPPSLVAQVEQVLRQAIADGCFPSGRLPTEVELAEQLGVSRETVRLAAEALQRDGWVVKIRHRGTFTRLSGIGRLQAVQERLVAYLQTDFADAQGRSEVANRQISGWMLQGALEMAAHAGYQLVVRRTSPREWRRAVQAMADSGRFQGLICASYREEKMLRRLTALGLPTVLVDEETNLSGIPSVRDDSFGGAVLAIRYLSQLGHRRIAYAHWARDEMNPSRPLGYRQGMRAAGLYRRRPWEILTELTESGARAMVDALLALKPRPTALYCFNNTLAQLAIEELRRRGVRVPEEISVMGAGGEEIAGLTCHQTDWYQMGRTAMTLLLCALKSPQPIAGKNVRLPHKLCVGQTVAPPKT
jgi:DNA-binding LacI/PurR family transcriptional regulator